LEHDRDDGGFGFSDYETGDQNVGLPPPLLPLTATDTYSGFLFFLFARVFVFNWFIQLHVNIINMHCN